MRGATTHRPLPHYLRRGHKREYLSIRNMMPTQIFYVMGGVLEISEKNRVKFPLLQRVGPPHWVGQE
jgi:hypothetical protein